MKKEEKKEDKERSRPERKERRKERKKNEREVTSGSSKSCFSRLMWKAPAKQGWTGCCWRG